jgi:hypothetical protein
VKINGGVDRSCEPLIVKGGNVIDLLTLVTGFAYAVALFRSYWRPNARMDDLFARSYSFLAPSPSYPWESDLLGPVDEEREPLLVNPPAAPPDFAALIAAAIAAARDGGASSS